MKLSRLIDPKFKASLTLLNAQKLPLKAAFKLKTIIKKIDNVTVTIDADPAEPFPLAGFLALAMGPGGAPNFDSLKPLNLKIDAK